MEINPDLERLKYPIGKFDPAKMESDEYLERSIFSIETFPVRLQKVINKLNNEQLDTPYRPGGWTIRQLAHHIPDSHINAYVRFKWTLTEDSPTIKAYFEDRWATLPDSKAPIYLATNLLTSLHEKWVVLMKGLNKEQWERAFIHPQSKRTVSLKEMVGTYSWHGEHHLAHIKNVIIREGWS